MGSIVILSKETYTPIDRYAIIGTRLVLFNPCNRTKLSKALVTDPAKIEWRSAADLKIKYGTNIRLGVVCSLILSNYLIQCTLIGSHLY